MLFKKYFRGTKNHHLGRYLLNFEAISPLYQFSLKFEFTRYNEKPAEIDVKQIYKKLWFQHLKLPWFSFFFSSLPCKEVVAMQKAIAVQIKVG